MISPEKYYPEFDSVEVEETILPLAQFDEETLEPLRDDDPPPLARPMDETSAATVANWCDQAEEYPFQKVIRNIASSVAATGAVADNAALFADGQSMLVELLNRAEARVREVHTRPLVAAVNNAGARGRLDGATPQQRYQYFIDAATTGGFEQVGGVEFPLLRSITRVVLGNEVDGFRETCTRIAANRLAIAERFGIEATDLVASFGPAEGDTHNHGRSVAVLTFASGRRLVYKPRDVSCEAEYAAMAEEINARYGTSLAAATVLRRDGYGFVEFVEAADVGDMSAEFMAASGELGAVLYLLNARDMHFENILPTRAGPLPIDLETLLHPERIHRGPTPEAPGNAYATIAQSIYGIGILPLVMAGKDPDSGHVDLGFLGDQGQGASPFRSMQFDRPFTDEVRLVFRSATPAQRRTVVNELTEERTHDLGRRMADGFTRVYRAVLADRDGWADLLRRHTAEMRVRYVHNPTSLYAQTLRMTSGPGALDGPEPYLALLKRIAIASKISDRMIVRSELRQLAERDVPYFTVACTDTALTDGSGNPVGAHFDRSPLDLALAKLHRLNEFDLGEQLRLIYSAFASRFPDNHLTPAGDLEPAEAAGDKTAADQTAADQTAASPTTAGPTAATDGGNPAVPPSSWPALDGAMTDLTVELCDRLVATSLADRFGHLPRTWIGPLASADANRPWPPGVLGYDLYTGRTGPAVTLAAAGRLLDRKPYLDLATQIFSTTADILATHRYEARSIQQAGYGGYTGLAGILFGLATAGRLVEEPRWVRAAQGALPLVFDQIAGIPADQVPIDVIGGLAGVMSCAMAIGGEHAQPGVEALTGILVKALTSESAPAAATLSQSGFAHGVSGLVYVLSRALGTLPDHRRPLAEATLTVLVDRLDACYDPTERNWRSNMAAPATFATGWCHGSTGVALALAAYREATANTTATDDRHGQPDPRLDERLSLAIGNVLNLGFGRNLTWCHGDLGNHDALVGLAGSDATAGAGTGLAERIAEVERRWLRPEVMIRKIGDPRSRYAHTTSLMVGTSGIALHLVNRLDPTTRVSPITLETKGR